MIVAIDPGTTKSAYLFYNGEIKSKGILDNECLVRVMPGWQGLVECMVIEDIVYGYNVGRELLETVRWCGRFQQALLMTPTYFLTRRRVVSALCRGIKHPTDKDVRAALCMRFGWPLKGRNPHGIATHLWAALAVAVVFGDIRHVSNGHEQGLENGSRKEAEKSVSNSR